MKTLLTFVLVLIGLSTVGDIIPANRLVTWQGNVGIPGGILYRTNIFCNVTNSIPGTNIVAVGDDVHDDDAAIQAALNLCPSNQVVYVPAGSYFLTNTLFVKSYTTLRGDGMGNTILDFHGTNVRGISFATGSGPFGTNNVNVVSNAFKGSTNITLSGLTVPYSGFNIAPGYCLILANLNDTNFSVYPGDVGGGGNAVTAASDENAGPLGDALNGGNYGWPGPRYCGQTVMVLTTNAGNSVTFTPPLYVDYTNPILSPIAAAYKPFAVWAGAENLTVKANNTGMYTTLYMNACAYCWFSGIEGNRTDNDQMDLFYDYRCEVDNCFLHDAFVFTSGTDNELLLGNKSSGCLIQNNVLWRLHAGIMLESGASGNVIAYNYWGGGLDSYTTNWTAPGFIYHMGHPMFNLFEGNVGTKFNADSVHGSSSDTTLFRNWFLDGNWANPPLTGGGPADLSHSWETWQYDQACWISALAPVFNVVGNVLGTEWGRQTNGYWMTVAPLPFLVNGAAYGAPQPIGLCVGYFGTSYGTNSYDTNHVYSTAIITGNYNPYDRTNQWDTNGIQTIPYSLYLTNTPSSPPTWWTNYGNTSTWPPIGPDVAGLTNTIPAKLLFAQQLGIGTTNLTLTANPSPSTNGVSVTFTATVMTNAVAATDGTGTMYYFDGANLMATNGVSSGVGSYSTVALTVGTHTIGFGYSGNYGTNWNTLTQVVYSNYVPPMTNSSAAGTASTTGAILTGVSFNSTPRTVYYITTSANGWLDTTNWMAGTISFPLDGSTPTNFDFNVSKIPANVDIQLLPGTFQHNSPILMKSGQNLYGSGMYSSVLQWPATNLNSAATITGTNAIVSDLTIDDNYQTGTNITMAGIHLGGTGSKIHNVCLANCASVTATNGAYSESFGLMVVGDSNSEISGCVVTNYTANRGLAWNNMSAIGLWGSGCKVLNNTVYEKAGSPVFAYGVIGDTATCSNNTSIGTRIGYHSDTPGGVTNLNIINSLFTNVACAMFFANSVDKNVNFLSNTVSLNNTNTGYGTYALFGENTGTYTNVLVAGNTFILTTNFTGGPVLYYGYNLDHLTMTNNWMSTSFTNILTSCTSTVVTNNFNLSGGSYNP